MIRIFARSILSVALLSAACKSTPSTQTVPVPIQAPTDVRLLVDEADAALEVIRKTATGEALQSDDWKRLFTSQGYQHLVEREAEFHHTVTDSSFERFLTSDTLRARYAALEKALRGLRQIDVTAAAARARTYLPQGTHLRATLYLEIKPVTNSFVFTGRDSVPSIFLYVDPGNTPGQVENIMAHELHHIGLNAACPDRPYPKLTAAQGMLLRFLGAYGEGQAMLAAAGGPNVHPHAVDPDSIKRRWDNDVARAPADMETQATFFRAVLDGRIATADSVRRVASNYFGIQGPWYTVGWLMATTVERQFGRAALIASLCQPTEFLARYNDAARRANQKGGTLPLWDASLILKLQALARAGR